MDQSPQPRIDHEDIPYHELANIAPLVEGQAFDELVRSIKENGLREAIVLCDGQILDGRNRYRACRAAGVEPRFVVFNGRDPIKFVLDMNVHRRHLSIGQRALIAARLNLLTVGKTKAQHPTTLSQREAANMLNISRDAVSYGCIIMEHGTPDEIRAVESNEAAPTPIAMAIRRRLQETGKSATGRKHKNVMGVGRNVERQENMRIKSEIWGKLRDALDALTTLPLPQDVAVIAANNKQQKIKVEEKLERAIQWITEFKNEWANISHE